MCDPQRRPAKGNARYDNLYQVRVYLDVLERVSIEMIAGGFDIAVDEITIGMQGAHASLSKQNCGKFKAAGDGLQADTLAKRGGYAVVFCLRGDSRLPSVNLSTDCRAHDVRGGGLMKNSLK
eukprot:4877388-Pleurochrysis_carterae.AAC.2